MATDPKSAGSEGDAPAPAMPPTRRRRGPWWLARLVAGLAVVAVIAGGYALAPETHEATPTPTTGSAPTGPVPVVGADDRPYVPVRAEWDHRPSPPVDPGVLADLRFTDVTEAAGLDAPRLGRAPVSNEDMTGGAAVGDYDDDGDLDLYLTRLGLPNALYRNDGDGTFTDVAAAAGVEGLEPKVGYAGALFFDVEGDGDLDLLVTTAGTTRNLLYVNDGSGRFTEEAERRGLRWPATTAATGGSNTFSAAAADWDHDGDLDLAVLDWYTAPLGAFLAGEVDGYSEAAEAERDGSMCERAQVVADAGYPIPEGPEAPAAPRTKLFANDGGGTFEEVTADLGVDPRSMSGYSATFTDVDRDGWVDLLVAGDFCTSALFHNDQGRAFSDRTDEAGLGTDENGMGQVVEDLDGDGLFDVVVTGISFPSSEGPCNEVITVGCSGNRVYLANGDGTFRDATDQLGVRDAFWAWGATAQDFSNLGGRDLVVTAGWLDSDRNTAQDLQGEANPISRRSANSPSRYWRSVPSGPWPEVADQVGITDRGNGKALVAFDYDRDGDLDLLKVNTETAPVLYRNDSPGEHRRWLGIRLEDPTGRNRWGVGSRVSVATDQDATPTAEVRAGGSFQSGDPAEIHVGLGSARATEALVWWPGSAGPERFPIGRDGTVLTLVRGEGAGP